MQKVKYQFNGDEIFSKVIMNCWINDTICTIILIRKTYEISNIETKNEN